MLSKFFIILNTFAKIIKKIDVISQLLEVSHPMFMFLNGLSISSFFPFFSLSFPPLSLSFFSLLLFFHSSFVSHSISHYFPLSPFLDRERFGHEEIGAENGKKENRSATGELFKFREFLDVRMSLPYYLSLIIVFVSATELCKHFCLY